MRKINVAEDLVPIGEIKTHASELFRRMHENGRPLVVAQNGHPAAVVLTPEAFEDLGYRELVKAKIRAGIESAASGTTLSSGEARERIKARLRRLARR